MNKGILIYVFILSFVFQAFSQQILIDGNTDQKGIVFLESQGLVTEEVLPYDNNFVFRQLINYKDFQSAPQFGNEVIKTSHKQELLLPGEYAVWEINTADESLTYIKPVYSLTTKAQTAMEQAPDWLRMDLLRQFRKLYKVGLDDDFADLIINADQNIKDEVAFQVANIPYESLIDTRFRAQMNMLVTNAELIYAVDDSLKYVEIVEHGTYANRDYYTTTKYKVKSGTNTVYYELPRDIYYWYIVHPRLHEEGVYEKDNTGSSQQRTWGYFWREYLWFNPDSTHNYKNVNKTTSIGTVSTIPRLGETMQIPEYLWDRNTGTNAYWLFNRTPVATDHALNRLGWWASHCVPIDPGTVRPIQPNQIAFEHWGRCGEDTYLLTAAARTCLIPTTYMGTMGEDHVWCGVYENDVFNHFEFFRGGLQNSGWGWTSTMKGGGYERLSSTWIISHIMTYRPDGAIGQNTSDYTGICHMTVTIGDSMGNPVDGAKAILYCKPGPYSANWQLAGYWFTNHTGQFTIPLGDNKQYGFQISHPKFGIQPSSTTFWPVLTTNSVKGQNYTANLRFSGKRMPESPVVKTSILPSTGSYGIHLNFTASEIIAGKHSDDAQLCQFADRQIENGSVGFFVCNEENYNKFKSGQKADVYQWVDYFGSGNIWMPLPGAGKWYVVLSNWHSTVNYQEIDATCELVSNASKAGSDEIQSDQGEFRIYPNPAKTLVHFYAPAEVDIIEIFDLFGRKVETITHAPFIWMPSADIPDGMYMIKAISPIKHYTGRVVLER